MAEETPLAKLKPGDRVLIVGDHPWTDTAGELIAYETYGLGWKGWRVKLDDNNGECYANTAYLRSARAR